MSVNSVLCSLTFDLTRYHEQAAALNVSISDLYSALVTDAESEPGNWNLQGRQANAWVELGELISQNLSHPLFG